MDNISLLRKPLALAPLFFNRTALLYVLSSCAELKRLAQVRAFLNLLRNFSFFSKVSTASFNKQWAKPEAPLCRSKHRRLQSSKTPSRSKLHNVFFYSFNTLVGFRRNCLFFLRATEPRFLANHALVKQNTNCGARPARLSARNLRYLQFFDSSAYAFAKACAAASLNLYLFFWTLGVMASSFTEVKPTVFKRPIAPSADIRRSRGVSGEAANFASSRL